MAPGIEEDAVLPFHEELAKKFKSKPHVQTISNALTEVITERKGPLSPASYFGVIITTLSDGKEKTEEEIASLLAVLTFVFEKLSIAILRMKFAHAAGVLLNIFEQCAQSAPILNKLTKCISLLVQVQEPATLQQQEAMNCLQLLLTLSADDRSSVVRATHSAILSIIKSATPQTRKILCTPLTHYFTTTLSQGASAEEACISALKLIKLVFPYMPANNIGTLCEAILQVPTHSIAVLTTAAYQSIGGLLGTRDEEDDTVVELGAAQLNALAEALIDVQPHFNDVRPLIEYSFLMASLYVELARADEDSCSQKLPTLFEHFVPNFAAENPEIANATHDALTMLVQKCISDKMIQQGSKAAHSPLRRIVATMETSLSPQYHRNWNKALLVIAALFERLGTHSSTFLSPILTTVGELYNTLTPQIHMPVFAVLGYAISAMGPKRFLEILPLNLDSPEFGAGDHPNRAWLLPLLRSNIEQTELKFFVDYFIPLGSQISTLAQKAEATGKVVEAKNKNIVADQIWDLFPAFCDLPVDLAQSFKAIAKTLGTLINDVPTRRKVVFAGLLKLLEKNKEVAKSEKPDPSIRVTPDMSKAGLKAMGAFSKNFLPILFAQYEKLCTGEAAAEFRQREALFNLIAAYISISEPQIVTQFFKTLMQKLLETSTEAKGDEADEEMDDEAKEKEKEKQAADKRRRALIDSYTDLTSAFVPSLSLTDLDFLYRVIKPYFTSQSIHLQKKSYKVLRAMCSQPSFVKKFYDEIRDMVLKTLHECSSTAKKQRIYVLQELLPHMELKDIMTPAIIADIIFSSREISAGSRKVALQLVSKIAHKAQENGGTEGLQDFVNLLVAGLAGTTPVMMSGSIFALTRIVVDFKDVLSPLFINELFSTLTLLLQSKHVEVMTASVLFIKTTLNIVDIEDVPKHMKSLAEGFAMMMREHKGKFREYAQPVLARLIKKFGYEEVAKHFPEESHKVLRATNKQERQKKDKTKKEKPEKEGEDESSDEDDAEFLGENLLGDKAYDKEGDEGETFIIEEEEPVDFLDKKAMKSVISAKPQGKVEKSKKKNEFKMLPDGRLLIQDSDDEESHDIYYNEKDKLPIDDRMLDEVDKEMFGNKSRKMTKKRMLEEANRAEEHDQDDDPEAVRPINEKFKKNRAKPKPYAGHQFKAKKAGGDVKIGKLDPFAYIPLDMRNLNKRRRQQAVLPFKALAKGAKRSKT